jgi:hypothetical protein
MSRAVDLSNYSTGFTAENLATAVQNGLECCIIQAFPPTHRAYPDQCAQAALCDSQNVTWMAYIYDYLASPDWRDGCLDGLSQLVDQGHTPYKLWADEEDVTPDARGMSVQDRIAAIDATVQALNSWSASAGLTAAAGIYTAAWWWVPNTGNDTSFSTDPLWAAQYDDDPDTVDFKPFGGWTECAIKQFRGTSTLGKIGGLDLDVLDWSKQ